METLRRFRESSRETIDKNRHLEAMQEIIEYLNLKAGRRFTGESRTFINAINKYMDKGITVQDFKGVIDFKCKEWIGTKFEKYLRPDTLFRMNFESYLEESKSNFNESEPPKKEFIIKGYTELITALRQMKYSDYLITEHWLHFKKQALIFFRNSCHLCGSNNYIDIHHKTYANRGRETFNDVVCLCRDCHAKFHDK